MISSRALKGFLFAFLLVLAGGLVMLSSSVLSSGTQMINLNGFSFYFVLGLALILLGLFVGLISLVA